MPHRGSHPLNTGFTWERATGPFHRLTAEQVDSYDRRGFFVAPKAFDDVTVRRLLDEIDPIEAKIAELLSRRTKHDVSPYEFTIASNLVRRSDLLRRICANSAFTEIARDLIGPDLQLYWEQSVYKKPHTPRTFPWHQDNGKVFVRPQQYITCWLALTKATELNGCPVMAVPAYENGLHREGTLRHWQNDEGWTCWEGPVDAVPVPLEPGDVAVFSSVTVHMTYGNRTDETRKAYVVQYAPADFVEVG